VQAVRVICHCEHTGWAYRQIQPVVVVVTGYRIPEHHTAPTRPPDLGMDNAVAFWHDEMFDETKCLNQEVDEGPRVTAADSRKETRVRHSRILSISYLRGDQ
ncbi:uncharacterized protein METZ01_LOCUS182996, partial [marine metagenome]